MKIYNDLTRQKEEFKPIGDEVKIYVCGVTVYSDSHIGHAMFAIYFDVVRRYLEYRDYRVKYIQNITDIDDKIIDRANRDGKDAAAVAEYYAARWMEDLEALNVKKADVHPKATEEIPKMIEMIRGLVDKGFAYPSAGSVYFRVKKVDDYGKLSHRNLEDLVAGETAAGGDDKESPLDFVIWKASKPGEPAWESPWGPGRPGWHIECSAMCLEYLGEQIDIHGGGEDLVFPHHENEIVQSESYTGKKPFAKYWMHNGMLQLGSEKMSKSLGNLVTIREALGKHSSDALRVLMLSSHYRSPLTYSEDTIEAAEKGAARLREAVAEKPAGDKGEAAIDTEAYRTRFIEAMDDDFGMAQGLAALFDLARDINREADGGYGVAKAQALLAELAGVLGLTLKEAGGASLDAGPYVELLLSVRRQLREIKQWQLADEIRDSLAELGIEIKDTPQGAAWKQKR